MRIASRVMAGALLAGAFVASPANAQNVSYSTTGIFSGPAAAGFCTNGGAAGSSCTSTTGFTLTFNPILASTNNVPNVGGTVPLGSFFLTGNGVATTAPANQLLFTIAINQTAPTAGTGNATGSITGTVQSTGGNYSTLIFTPNQTVTIGSTTYTLVFDQGTNGIRIAYNGPEAENTTLVKAQLTQTSAVPEPASMTLLATGLVGIFGAARRRRKNAR